MITTYHDCDCRILRSSQNLELNSSLSALWFRIDSGSDLTAFLKCMLSVFDKFSSYFWLAAHGSSPSPKIRELKRAFGIWLLPAKYVVSKFDYYDKKHEKLYSDIVQINDINSELVGALFERDLFGVDSTVFFLPANNTVPKTENIAGSLTDLLIRYYSPNKSGVDTVRHDLLEKFVEDIIKMGGISTIVLRDVNMTKFIVAVGSRDSIDQISRTLKHNTPSAEWRHEVREEEFARTLDVGVGISSFG